MSDAPSPPPERLHAEALASADLTQPWSETRPHPGGGERTEREVDEALRAIHWKPPEEPHHSPLRRLLTWPGRWVRRQAIRAIGANLWERQQEQLNSLLAKLDHLSARQTAHNVSVIGLLDTGLGSHRELLDRLHDQLQTACEQLSKRLDDHQRSDEAFHAWMQGVNPVLDDLIRHGAILWGTVDRKVGFIYEEREMAERIFDFYGESRGAEASVTEQQSTYVQEFAGKKAVVDLGCGRGEFLELLGRAGIPAEGVDIEERFAPAWKRRNVTVHVADILEWLCAQPDASRDGIFCAQVVEHFPLPTVDRLIAHMARVLRPDGRLVIETLSPISLNIFMGPFWADPTHRQPIHPWTLSVLCQTRGLMENRVVYSAPPPAGSVLPRLKPADFSEDLQPLVDRLDRVISQLNDALYGPAHYAVISRRGRPEELGAD